MVATAPDVSESWDSRAERVNALAMTSASSDG